MKTHLDIIIDDSVRLVVDDCRDAAGNWTVRIADGTAHGRTDVQPIATFYNRKNAERFVDRHNLPPIE
jgi:hypothetical protein